MAMLAFCSACGRVVPSDFPSLLDFFFLCFTRMSSLLHRCGDIGPKIGFNTMDNGFLILDRVRIPRGNMAMRHQQVDKDGVYTSTGSTEGSKIAYISMMQASEGNDTVLPPFHVRRN